MPQRPRTTSQGLHDHPWLVAAIAFTGIGVVLALLSIVSGSMPDVSAAVFYGLTPILFTWVGVVILAQMPDHGVGRLALAIGFALALSGSLTFIISMVDAPGPVTVVLPGVPGALLEIAVGVAAVLPSVTLFIGGAILVVWFPDGRPASRLGLLAQVLVLLGLGAAILMSVRDQILRVIGYSPSLDWLLGLSYGMVFLGLASAYLVAILDLVIRYRRADPVRQTQMRWVLAAVLVELVLTVLAFTLSDVIEGLWVAWIASSVLPIIAIAIAITRYHLYDIDRIISQTLTYAVLTVVLFAAFGSVNLVLQQWIRPLIGGSAGATAISTLVVAALFNPARIRIQGAVDRRFHRARYDAERTVQGFAGRMRDEVDLPTLVTELRGVAMDAVEPSTTVVWLRVRRVG